MNTSTLPCPYVIDNAFGPAVNGCRGGFDFSLLFEQSIMTIGPAALFLLFGPYRLWQLAKEDRKTKTQWLLWTKQAFVSLSAALQLAILILWASFAQQRNKASLAASSLSFIVGILLCILSYFEHLRSVRPSTIVEIYLFFSIATDAVQVRTLWLQQDTILAGVMSASLATKVMILVLEAREKRQLLHAPYTELSPETTSGVFSRSTFYWLSGLFKAGFTSVIVWEDLPRLDSNLLSRQLCEQMQYSWDKTNHSKRYALFISTFRCLWGPFLAGVVPRLAIIGFNYSQPFLITRIIDYVGQPDDVTTTNDGYGLIGATALLYAGLAISTAVFKHKTYRVITMFRGAIVSIIYSKTLVISDGAYDNAAALTLMSTDIDRITTSLEIVHEIWANFCELGIALFLLERQVGVATIVTVVLAIVGFFFSGRIAKHLGPNQADWNKGIQRRVAVTSTSLKSMKAVKLIGLTDVVAEHLQSLRIAELELCKAFMRFVAWMNTNSNFPEIVAPFVTFAIVYGQAGTVDVAQAFTSLAIIMLLTGSLAELLSGIPRFAASLGSFDRIQQYLLSSELVDNRKRSQHSQVFGESYLEHPKNDTELKSPEPMLLSQSKERQHFDKFELLRIVAGCFGEPQILQDINMILPKSSLTMIVGSVGSGKSMLLKAMLGELPATKGSVYTDIADVAYCAQEPWLINASIRQNVLGPSGNYEKDKAWFRIVTYACGLDPDIAGFPEGDELVIGSGGVRLSGGQKQRVALARAVFSRKPLVLLDDVTSGLDAKTCDWVFERLLGPNGLLRQLGSTVALATHAVRYLHLADNVVALNSNGTIARQGAPKTVDLNLIRIASDEDTKRQDVKDLDSAAEHDSPSPNEKQSAASEEQDVNRKIGDLSIYSYWFKAIGWKNGVVYLFLYTGYVFFFKFPQVWLQLWTEANERSPGSNAAYYLGIYGLLTVLSLVVVWSTIQWWFVKVIPESAQKLHLKLLTVVMRAPLSFFTGTDNGITLNRFSQDMQLVDQALPSAAFATTFAAMTVVAEAALISSGAGLVAVTIPPTVVIVWVLQKFYLRTSRQLRFLDLEAKSPLYTHFTETLSGLHTIRAFGWQEYFSDSHLKLLDTSQKPYYLLYCIQRWLNLVLDLMVAAIAVLLVTIATQDRSLTSRGAIGVALNNVLGFNQTLAYLINSWTTLETSLGAVSRLRAFEQQTEDENKPQETLVPPQDWPQHGAIEFLNVSSSPSPGSENIIHNISLSIKAGEKVGICGPTGSGKTSLLLTLLHLFDYPTSGTLTVDSLDASLIPRTTLRQRITTIPQDAFFLPGCSARFNLDPYGRHPDARLVAALQRVGLWARLAPASGLDTVVADWPLSHGQRQLLCLARALVAPSRVLLLDEATSSVDAATEELVSRIVAEDFRGSTVVAVAHRLRTIVGFDTVVVMEAGRIVEVGPPAELLEVEGGRFRGLWERQRGG